jgi:hypothetical protein
MEELLFLKHTLSFNFGKAGRYCKTIDISRVPQCQEKT